jgi:hypothetical protein
VDFGQLVSQLLFELSYQPAIVSIRSGHSTARPPNFLMSPYQSSVWEMPPVQLSVCSHALSSCLKLRLIRPENCRRLVRDIHPDGCVSSWTDRHRISRTLPLFCVRLCKESSACESSATSLHASSELPRSVLTKSPSPHPARRPSM